MPAMSARHLRPLVSAGRCWYCNEPIEQGTRWAIHHKNGNHHDDRNTNLAAVHHGCHTKLHRPWEHITDDGRQRLSAAARRNKPWTYPNPGHTGHEHTIESRTRMSASKLGTHKGWTWRLINGKRVWIPKEEPA